MDRSSARPVDAIETIVHTYGNMLLRLSLVMLGNEADAEDAVQETVIKYMLCAPDFKNNEHEKAWLIKVITNKCRDMLRYKSAHPLVDIEQLSELPAYSSDSSILEALMELPEKFRLVLLLYYVEGYSAKEIAQIIGRSVSAVKMRLMKGRKLLEEKYRKEFM